MKLQCTSGNVEAFKCFLASKASGVPVEFSASDSLVPVLEIDKTNTLRGADAICQYLAAKQLGRPLVRSDPFEAARVMEVVDCVQSTLGIHALTFLCSRLEAGSGSSEFPAAARSLLGDDLRMLESHVRDGFGAGASLSLADCFLFPVLFLLLGPGSPAKEEIAGISLVVTAYFSRLLSSEKVVAATLTTFGINDAQQFFDFARRTGALELQKGASAQSAVEYQLSARPNKTVMITTPIYYVNAAPHIGHVYTTIIADAMTRWFRLRKIDAFMMTGTDEHGQKVAQSAEAKGITPKQFCDIVSAQFRNMFDQMGCAYDYFIRTTDQNHEEAVRVMWKRLADAGLIYKGAHEGWYSITDECFYTDLQVRDDVDASGKPCKRSVETGAVCEWHREENYLFRLSAFQSEVAKWLEASSAAVVPAHRYHEVVSFVAGGLRDLSVSRSKATTKWGIEVPGDEKQLIYVWLDALTNYLTASGFPQKEGQPDWMWPCDYHVVGKDILKFHAIYWPAFLSGAKIALPKRIVAHGWWTKDRQKISKSLGNVFDPLEVASRFGLDCLRFFLLREASIGADGDYSDSSMVRIVNNDLADVLGNLVLRCTSSKIVPAQVVPQAGSFTAADQQIIGRLNRLPGTVDHFFVVECEFQKGLAAIWDVLSDLNRLMTEMAPWKLVKTDPDRCSTVMYLIIEGVRMCTMLFSPVMPNTAEKIFNQLGVPANMRTGDENMVFGRLPAGIQFGADRSVLFQKHEITVDAVSAVAASTAVGTKASGTSPADGQAPAAKPAASAPKQKAAVAPREKGTSAAAAPEQASSQEIDAMDIRIGKIVDVKRHPDADSLYVEQIDVGEEAPRTVISGLVKYVSIEQMHGALVPVICNLKPAKMRGIVSAGMVMVASSQDHSRLELLGIPAGSKIGERVVCEGHTGAPDQQLSSKKLEAILPFLCTDADCVPNYKGKTLGTTAGACTCTIPNANIR